MDVINIIKRLLAYLKPFRKRLSGLLILVFLQAGLLSIAPYLTKPIIDKGYANKDLRTVIMFGAIGFSLYLAGMLLASVYQILSQKIKRKIYFKCGTDYSDRLYDMSLGFFRKKNLGTHVYSLSADIEAISQVIVDRMTQLILNGLKLLFYLVLAISLSWQLAIFMLIILPFYIIKSRYFSKRNLTRQREWITASRDMMQKQVDTLSKIPLVKISGAENLEKRRYLNILDEKLKIDFNIKKLAIINKITADMLSKISIGAAGLYGIILIMNNVITLGDLSAFLLYFGLFTATISPTFFTIENFMSRDALYIKRFFDVLDTKCEIIDPPRSIYVKKIKGDIRIKDLEFSYNGVRPALKDCNINIKAGRWSALTGPSGCGKTTLINLILRLYGAQKGSIFIDGTNIKDIKIQSLRENIALAGQDVMLFSGSLAYNITYGTEGKTEDDLIEACKTAHIYETISKLPDGLDSNVGDDAFRFSEGQKQRLCLARAIIRQPQVLILDEALSSVDIETEMKIYRALKDERSGLTTIIVSQRPSALEVADDIFQMDFSGKIIKEEMGFIICQKSI